NHAPSALQTSAAAQLQLQTLAVPARSPASPATNGHLTQKSSHCGPPRPASTLHSRSPPAALLLVSIHSQLPAPVVRLLRAPAISADRASHSLSPVSAPALPSAAGPCTRATAPANMAATQPPSRVHSPTNSHPPLPLHIPPATALRAPSPPLAAPPHDSPAPLRSLPTRCENRAASPGDRCVPETRYSRRPDSAPSRPCDTSVAPADGCGDAG